MPLKVGQRFQNDVILIRLRKERRDLSLAKRVIERVVNHLRRDAESRSGYAVDDECSSRASVLLVRRHVPQFRQRL